MKSLGILFGLCLAVVSARASEGLSDLDKMTFACPQAGLNAAAREAAKAPTQGSYQFVYYKVVNPSQNAEYDVRFESNVQGEPNLEYAVTLYCQQGWDPNKTVVVKLK